MPVPYIIYGEGKTLLVAANPYDHDVEMQISIPQGIVSPDGEDVILRDVWRKKGGEQRLTEESTFRVTIPRDYISGGGLSVWDIKMGSKK